MNRKVLIGIIAIYLLILLIYVIYKRKKNKSLTSQIVRKRKVRNYLYPFTLLFSTVYPFKKSFEKVKKRVGLLYPTAMDELNLKVAQSMLISLGISLALFIVIIITAGQDIFYIGFGATICIVIYQSIIDTQYENAYQKILRQTYDMLAIVNHNFYLSNGKIDDAVYMSIDECPYEMSLHLERIHNILISIDIEKEVNQYLPTCPNKFLMNFVATTTSVIKYGDKELENGNSMLLTNFEYLKDDIHNELENIKYTNQRFIGRTFIALLPVVFIKPVQIYVLKYLPDVSDFYVSLIGMIIQASIFILSIISYIKVLDLKDRGGREIKEHTLLFKISRIPGINTILTAEMNKNYSKTQKISQKLKLAGEKIGFKQFLLQKIILAIAVFIGFQGIIFFSQWQEKNNILTDFTNSFKSSYITNDELKEEMVLTAQHYLKMNKKILEEPEMETVMNDIIATSDIKKPIYAELIANEVITKINKYNDIYYRWYFLLISILLSYIAFYVPDYLLNGKIKAIKMGMEDEVAQFQNIVMMLMHADGMNLKIILEWMERFSYCFSDSIQKCINELPYEEETAIKEMRDTEMFEPFRRFCSSMLIVNEQGLLAAFAEIVKEREHNIKSRASDSIIQVNKRASRATLIALLPSIDLFVFYIGYPLALYSKNAMNIIGIN